ncbi:MAG TPA: DUF4365 domain-containing protein [Puia sp.]
MKKASFGGIPLPADNQNENLETVSRNKLLALLGTALFEARPETLRDKGNDLIVEIKQNNCYTNFHFSVQLKSTDSIKPNRDGSLSYPVAVSNIHYLSNYAMPAYYILYEKRSDTFYIEDASHVFRSLFKKYPEKLPLSFSIRFAHVLDTGRIEQIHEETLEKGMLLRRMNAHFNPSGADPDEVRGIVIDEDNEVYSVNQNMAFIEQYGFLLLNRNEFKRIIEIEQRTHPRTTATPAFNFICGIAYFQHASLYKAIDFLREAQQQSGDLLPEIASHLNYILLEAKYLLGIITEEQMKAETARIMNTGQIGSFLQLENVNRSLAAFKGNARENMRQFYEKITQLISSEPGNNSLLVMAYAYVLDAEAITLLNDLTNNLAILFDRISRLSKTKTYQEWKTIEVKYSERLRQLMEFALKEKNYLAMSNLAMNKIEWMYQKIFIAHIFNNWGSATLTVDGPLNKEDKEILLKNIAFLDHVSQSYESLKHQENLINCLRLKYELLNFVGQEADASDTAERINRIIDTNDFNGLRLKHDRLIQGNTRYSRFIKTLAGRITDMRETLSALGMDGPDYSDIPEEVVLSVSGKPTWSVEELFEFQFPA